MSHTYRINLYLNPVDQSLSARVALTYTVAEPTDTLVFSLHRSLKPDITSPGLTSVECMGPSLYPFTLEAHTWRLTYDHTFVEGSQAEIEFSYSGYFRDQPWSVNRLTEAWVELGMYAPWYPWNPNGGDFNYCLKLEINPNYTVASTGKTAVYVDGHWTLTSTIPVRDIVIAAAPDLQLLQESVAKATLSVYYTPVEDISAVKSVGQDGLWLLNFYQQWFGTEDQARNLNIISAPRSKGGGYARPGFIVLSDITQTFTTPGYRLFKWIAHEMAHLWWTDAQTDTWEDWLNESFAEFSKLMAVKAKLGQAALEELVVTMQEKALELPPIRGIDRTSEQAYLVLYIKGALVLYRLMQLIGEQKMTELLRLRLTEKVVTTESLLALLRRIAGAKAAMELDSWLS